MRPEPQRLVDRREFPILYVDDEKENLRAFELGFRREYEVLTAENGRDALELINSHPIAVVLSDHRMPEMTGTEFLARVRAVDPRTIRFLVTAFGDARTLAEAINDGNIYRYIPKPWDMDELRLTLGQAIDLYALESERDTLISELTTLHRASRDLSRELDLQRLLKVVTRTVVDDLGFDAATLLLPLDGSFVVAAFEPSEGAASQFLEGFSVLDGERGTWMGSVQSDQTSLLTLEQGGDAGEAANAIMTEVAADEVLSVPLVSSSRTVGILLVDNRRGGRHFRAAERTLLEGLGAQAAIAIENAGVVESLGSAGMTPPIFHRLATMGGASLRLLDGATSESVLDLVSSLSRSECDEGWASTFDCLEDALAQLRVQGDSARIGTSTFAGAGKVRCDPTILTNVLSLVLSECLERSEPAGEVSIEDLGTPGLSICSTPTGGASELADSLRLGAAILLLQRAKGQIQVADSTASGRATVSVVFPE